MNAYRLRDAARRCNDRHIDIATMAYDVDALLDMVRYALAGTSGDKVSQTLQAMRAQILALANNLEQTSQSLNAAASKIEDGQIRLPR